MRHERQVELIREILGHLDRDELIQVDRSEENEARAYTCEERAATEQEILFRRYPIVVGFSSRLRTPGDYLTESRTPLPILVVRCENGQLRAFVNACRHRGSALTTDCGSGASIFSCPYHGWSYDTEGRLVAVPDQGTFPGLDRSHFGLRPLPVEERHGLIFVVPDPSTQEVAVAKHLGRLDEDLASYGFDRFFAQETRVLRQRMNWKLVSDTFWEAYHIKVLHRRTVGPIFLKNFACFEAMGSCHRLAAIHRSIETLRDQPEAQWDLVPHATILMNLFPNTVAIMQKDHAEIFQIFSVDGATDHADMAITILAPDPLVEGEPLPVWRRAMDLVVGVVEEDFEVGETIQRNFAHGAIDRVTYGRTEGALSHFHKSVREAIGEV